MEIVVIGNSTAGINAIESIRKHDKNTGITLISDESYKAYSHPLLPNLVVGEVSRSEDRFYYRRGEFYDKLNVKKILGRKVISVNPDDNSITLDNGRELSYDTLIITTGGKPFIPSVDGLELKGIHSLTNIKLADKLRKDLPNLKKCVIAGGGLIGTKLAEKLAHHGVNVTLVELTRRVLFPVLDDTAAELIHTELRNMGVRVILNDSVKELHGNKRVESVMLSSGTEIKTDGIIFATGVIPNVDIVVDSRVEVNRGIVVDEYMKTNVDNIYAAGDVAEGYDIVIGGKRPIPIIPVAAKQGSIAGLNAIGIKSKYEGGFPLNSITIGNVSFISMGVIDSEEFEVLQLQREDEYRKFLIKNNKLFGAILVHNIEKAGMFSWMIQTRFNVSWIKDTFLNSDFGWKYFDKVFRVLRLDRKIR